MSRITAAPHAGPKVADLVEHLVQFEGPPEQFLLELLAVQCHLSTAQGGAILRATPDNRVEILAVFPPVERGGTAPVWLAHAVESVPKVVSSGAALATPLRRGDELYGLAPTNHLLLLPLRGGAGTRGVAAFVLAGGDSDDLSARRERLELTLSLLSLYEMRLTLQRRGQDMQRLRHAFELLNAANEHAKFAAAAMAVANQVATRWNSDRVSLGFLQGRYVKLRAMSHTEKFTRKTKLVQDMEAAMEECLDQDVEIVYPSSPEATFVSRSCGELATHHGLGTVCCVPLRREGKPVGVLMLERPADKPFGLEEVETLRLACDLTTPRLVDLHEHDRWFGAKAAAGTRKALAKLVGPEHTWAKITAIAVLLAILFLTLVNGANRVEAPFLVEATRHNFIPAPFPGYLSAVEVEPGSVVKAGQPLARLDARPLMLELEGLEAEKAGYETDAAVAMRDGKAAEMQIALQKAAKAEADLKRLRRQIEQATIVSPIDGVVTNGDLKPHLDKKVEIGDVLFEIAPIESLRATLQVPEDRVADLLERQSQGHALEGQLATAASPGRYLDFTVERINPVAEVVDQQNVFKVRVALKGNPADLLRPGMGGVAKIDVGRRTYGYMWTRSLVNWVRMKLWI